MPPRQTSSNLIGKRYELQNTIGRGGMGVVYRAIDHLTGQLVALKQVIAQDTPNLMDSENGGGRHFRLALAQEFKLLASLHHPYIIEVKDYGFDDQNHQPYFTMELLENAYPITQVTQNSSLQEKLTYLVQMLQALTYLHRRGILHRDLKPANVLVFQGQIKVLDFGLSTMQDRNTSQSSITQTAGTIAYLAPEVLMGSTPSESADLYAVGMIAYEILANQYPFNDASVATLINDVIHTYPDCSQLDISADLALVIERLIQKDPEARYPTARDAIHALETAYGTPLLTNTIATRESFLQSARLIGRDSELYQLHTSLKNAQAGIGSAWLIGGESGVGKSRLLDELRNLAMVNGALVMRDYSSHEAQTPYHSWRAILQWLGLLTDLNPADAGLIKLLVPDIFTLPTHDPKTASELEPDKIEARLLHMLEQMLIAQNQPIVIILEDLHWASSESLSLFAHLAGMTKDLPLVLIGSYRDDERPNLPALLPDIPVIKLNRLNDQDIAQLSKAMLGEAGKQADVINLLQQETKGNVFFLIEVVRTLAADAGDLEQIGHITLPQNVFSGGIQQIITRRLSFIPQQYQHPLCYAAAIGRQQDLKLLSHILPDLNIEHFLAECANAAVFEIRDGVWQFVHDKLRDGVLATIAPQDLRDIHHQIAQAIETLYIADNHAALLTYHWGMANQPEKESYYASMAGEQALRSGAYHQAVTYFERSLQTSQLNMLSPRDSQLRRVYLQNRKAEAYLGFGGYDQAYELYQESLTISEHLNEKPAIAEVLYHLGNVDFVRNLVDRAETYYQDSLAIYRELNDRAGIARVVHSLGNIAYEKGNDEQAKLLYQESLSLSRQVGDQWGMAGALTTQTVPDLSEAASQDIPQIIQKFALHVQQKQVKAALNTLLHLAQQHILNDHKPSALSLLAFILNHPELPAELEDEAEQLTFELQNALDSQLVNISWERGKSYTFESILTSLKS
ncbi:MAG: serine/threonine-protein kinase PknK [Chloroflexi bacterium]|nr:MAG: serine/threonine-protein kinase PknK [Chloroflexota bacterium]